MLVKNVFLSSVVASVLLTTEIIGNTCYGVESPGNTYDCGDRHKGNCTWYAAYRRPDLNFPVGGRDAGKWFRHAKNYGFVVKDTPVAGSVAVVNMSDWGHVIYLERLRYDVYQDENQRPFLTREQDYTGSFTYKSVGHKTFETTYIFYPKEKGYQRKSSDNEFWEKKTDAVYGFIYPTRTIEYHSDEFDGVLVLMRRDGAIPQSCDEVEQATFYLQHLTTETPDKVIVSKLSIDDDSKYTMKEMCLEASAVNGFQDTDFGVFVKKHTPYNKFHFGGIGGGSGEEEIGLADGNIKKVEISRHDRNIYQHDITIFPDKTFDLKVKIENDSDVKYEDAQVYVYISSQKHANLAGDEPARKDINDVSDLEPHESKWVSLRDIGVPSKLGTY